MHIPVHVGDTAIIKQQQAKAHKEGGAAGGEQYTIVYLPPHFQARMAVYVVVIIPLLLDRVFLANHPKPNDVCAYALGALCCAIGLLLVARAWAAYARLFSQPTGGAQPDEWGVAKPKDVLDDDVWLRRPIRSPLLWTRERETLHGTNLACLGLALPGPWSARVDVDRLGAPVHVLVYPPSSPQPSSLSLLGFAAALKSWIKKVRDNCFLENRRLKNYDPPNAGGRAHPPSNIGTSEALDKLD
ncbi:hypothetical protein PtB15_5B167 [Puccinia triticina]|nr:hypothetical protein PtB15_5B167 [Puccinia triticina]